MRDKNASIEHGFTLIELLVVVVIIGIASGIALFAFGDFGTSRKIQVAAEQFSAYVKLVQQRAILESNTYGISVDKDGYDTFRLISGMTWQALSKNTVFHHQSFPAHCVVILHVRTKKNAKSPEIIISPSGDMSAFELDFGTSTQTSVARLTGKPDGTLFLDKNQP